MVRQRCNLRCGIFLLSIIILICVITLMTQKEKIERLNVTEKEWIQLAQNFNYSDYGDNTCGDHPYRSKYEKLLKRWLEIAKEYNVTYFLNSGTLLGAWRNQDVVPYDLDMDVTVSWEDNTNLEKIREAKPFSPWDKGIHLYIHKDWRLPPEKRRSFNCQGEGSSFRSMFV